jgi:biopolymer transport protein ExbD
MSRFRKSQARSVPALNTASLPDLIFTLLFFFMLVANMRSVPIQTRFQVPNASELQKLKEKSFVIYIIVGKQNPDNRDKSPDIQLNYAIIPLEKIPITLAALRKETKLEDWKKMIVVLKIDKNTPMGLVNDIRKSLKEADLLTVFYSADKQKYP